MPYLSKIVLLGHAGNVNTSNGKTRFSLAVSPEKDNTNWYTIFVNKEVKLEKGQLVLVSGKFIQRKNEKGVDNVVFADGLVVIRRGKDV